MFRSASIDARDTIAANPLTNPAFRDKEYDTTLFESYGVVKKDWVKVPNALLKNTNELKKYLNMSMKNAKSLNRLLKNLSGR